MTHAKSAHETQRHTRSQRRHRYNSRWKRSFASVSRWLHIYLSMVSFAIVLFFAVTGLTLNHQDWFDGPQRANRFHGSVDMKWVTGTGRNVAKLEIVEYLRRTHGIKAVLSDFRTDSSQCEVAFKGPGYQAAAFIDR